MPTSAGEFDIRPTVTGRSTELLGNSVFGYRRPATASCSNSDFSMTGSVKTALSSAVANTIMYGCAVWIALRGRSNQIEQKVWRQGSPRRLVPIAFSAGLLTWWLIVCSTVLTDIFPTVLIGAASSTDSQSEANTLQSLNALWISARSLTTASTLVWPGGKGWWLPAKMLGAVP